jgi:hypothetical protein
LNLILIVSYSLKYNLALDRFIVITISLVLLFHIWLDIFLFGYMDIDIFFVLSGFLITQIIVTKLDTNSFSFKKFYRIVESLDFITVRHEILFEHVSKLDKVFKKL